MTFITLNVIKYLNERLRLFEIKKSLQELFPKALTINQFVIKELISTNIKNIVVYTSVRAIYFVNKKPPIKISGLKKNKLVNGCNTYLQNESKQII